MKKSLLFLGMIFGMLLVVSGGGIFAQTITSNGTGGGDWNTAATWVGGVVPGAGNDVVIASGDSVTVYANAVQSCTNLTVNGTLVDTLSGKSGTSSFTVSGALTLNAGSFFYFGSSASTTASQIPGASYSFNSTSTFVYNGPTTIYSAPTYGILLYASSGNGACNGNLTVNGDLDITGGTVRGISATSGSYTHTVGGNANLTTATSKISGANSSTATSASCVWNIAGNVVLSGANAGNRLILFESAGPHSGTVTYNINGDVNIGAGGSQLMFKSSTSAATLGTGTINLKGNLIQNGTIGINSGGTTGTFNINFNGSSPQTWSGTGAFSISTLAVNITVDNAAGVTLTAPRNFNKGTILTLTNGNLTTDATNILTISSTGTFAGGSASSFVNGPMRYQDVTAGAATFTYPIGNGTVYRPVTLSLNQTTTTSSNYVAQVFLGNANTLNAVTGSDLDHVSSHVYYSISEVAGGSAFTGGAVTLSYGTQGLDDQVWDPGATRVANGPTSSGNWTDLGPSGTPSGMGSSQTGTVTSSVAFTDLTTNTIFALGSTTTYSDNPLPVEMTSFTASAGENGVTLHWAMASELNNSGWDVERAAVAANGDVAEFVKIGHIKGAMNSISTTTYSFLDRTALYGSFEYRLKQIDVDGNVKLSNPIKVALLQLPKTVELGSYPNPFNPTATLRFAIPRAGRVTLEVYNAIGQLVTTLENRNMDAGIFEATFDASTLPSGVYFARLSADNSVRFTKMLLVK